MQESKSHFENLHRAYAAERPKAIFKRQAEDFFVEERLSFSPSGEGEHLFLRIKKKGCNTQWVVKQLALSYRLSERNIGYAGKKDRHSVSIQWFSLYLPGVTPDPEPITSDEFVVLDQVRHNKKLRKGNLNGNYFEIVLRDISETICEKTIESIVQNGVPNYFGNQRFGRDGRNIELAKKLLSNEVKIKNREKKGMALSAARSFVFNQLLSKRVESKNWCRVVNGDCLMLNSSQSYFKSENLVDEQKRLDEGDLHIAGWLPGKQPSECLLDAQVFEQQSIQPLDNWINGLQRFGINSSRRAFRFLPKAFRLDRLDSESSLYDVKLSFFLPKGCYATALLREIVDVVE